MADHVKISFQIEFFPRPMFRFSVYLGGGESFLAGTADLAPVGVDRIEDALEVAVIVLAVWVVSEWTGVGVAEGL